MNTLTPEQVITIVIGVLQVLATLSIAVIVYNQTTKLKRLELTKQLNDTYNLVTQMALAKDENLIALDSIGREHEYDSIDIRRKRWCAFIWLVALENTYIMGEHRLVDRKFAKQALLQQLRIILADDLIYSIVLDRGYDPGFVEFCKDVRKEILFNVATSRNAKL